MAEGENRVSSETAPEAGGGNGTDKQAARVDADQPVAQADAASGAVERSTATADVDRPAPPAHGGDGPEVTTSAVTDAERAAALQAAEADDIEVTVSSASNDIPAAPAPSDAPSSGDTTSAAEPAAPDADEAASAEAAAKAPATEEPAQPSDAAASAPVPTSPSADLERAISPGADVAIAESQTSSAAERDNASVAAAAASEAEKDEEVEEVVPESVPKRSARSPSHHPPPPPRVRAQAASHGSRPLNIGGTPKFARDLMTRQLLTIGPADSIESLEQHMEAFRFRHLPVVDGNKLVGLITHSDLLHASSSFLSTSAKQENVIIHRLPASRIMQRDLITVRPNEPLADVANLMWETRVGCVLVVDEKDILVGIITEGDFVRLAHHFLTRQGSG